MDNRAAILARLIEVSTAQPPRRRPDQLGSACRDLLGADGTSITIDNSMMNRVVLTSTDAIAARLEDLQDVLGEGPSQLAYASAEPVATRLGSADDARWPEFTRSALDIVGPVTMRCFPIHPAGQPFGVLSTYVTEDRALDESERTAQFMADALGVTLLREPPVTEWPDVRDPWSSRAVVHQATGMIADQLDVATEDALTLLRARAYSDDEPLTEVAQYVVARRLHFDS